MTESIPIEIERTFMVKDVNTHLAREKKFIRQWYANREDVSIIDGNFVFSGFILNKEPLGVWTKQLQKAIERKKPTIRVRITDDVAIICVKGKRKGPSRIEMEWEIDRNVGLKIIENKNWPMVAKNRYYIDSEDGLVWELDQFLGNNEGLWLTEVELPNKNTDFSLPNWVGLEVTEDRKLSSHRLARNPLTFWPEENREKILGMYPRKGTL